MRRLTLLGLAAFAAAVASTALAAAPAHRHDMSTMSGDAASPKRAAEIALARLATAKHATNTAPAKKNGYDVIAQVAPDMGWHFVNPKITTFDVQKPPSPGGVSAHVPFRRRVDATAGLCRLTVR